MQRRLDTLREERKAALEKLMREQVPGLIAQAGDMVAELRIDDLAAGVPRSIFFGICDSRLHLSTNMDLHPLSAEDFFFDARVIMQLVLTQQLMDLGLCFGPDREILHAMLTWMPADMQDTPLRGELQSLLERGAVPVLDRVERTFAAELNRIWQTLEREMTPFDLGAAEEEIVLGRIGLQLRRSRRSRLSPGELLHVEKVRKGAEGAGQLRVKLYRTMPKPEDEDRGPTDVLIAEEILPPIRAEVEGVLVELPQTRTRAFVRRGTASQKDRDWILFCRGASTEDEARWLV